MKKIDFNNHYDLVTNTVKELKVLLKNRNLRLQVYMFMLKDLNEREKDGYSAGMCHCCPWFMKRPDDDLITYRLHVLPELWRLKPTNLNSAYWFREDDFETRRIILAKIISRMTKAEEKLDDQI